MAGRSPSAQPLGEQLVGEVGRGRHGAVILVNQLGPQQRIAEEVRRGDLDEFGAVVHRHGQVAGHAHVVETGQPTHDHVSVHVDVRAGEYGLGIGDDVCVGDSNRLG